MSEQPPGQGLPVPVPSSGSSPGDAGLHIGRYEVRSQLGRGGMGSVYRAFDPVLEREVALKVMLPEIVHDPEQKQRFEREARAVARLSHPAVVTVFDLGYHTDGSPYIVMELLRGKDLLARMRAAPLLSLAETVSIVGQLLEGLGHAHKSGIVHRDIKPANVFLTDDGNARIMDFGLAYFTSSGGTGHTLMGTVAYMSPEQVRGERLDGRSDLFSVGTALCELLTGRQPFKAETPAATLYRIANEEPRIELPPAAEHQRFLPLLRRALARQADQRFQTAAEFVAALRACAVGAMPLAPVESAPVVQPPVAAVSPTQPPAGEQRADPSGLFQLLRRIYVGQETGQLHLAAGSRRRSLRILKGRILSGSSDAEGEHLGDVLVRYGLLGQSDLERAVAVVLRERKRLGVVLSDMGLIEREALEEATGIHVREILFSALDRADVSFSFEELAESSVDADLASRQSTGQVILEATRRVFDTELVRRVLGDIGRVIALSPDPLLRSQKITLTPIDGFVLSRIDGTLCARDVMALIPLPAEDIERSLFSLLCTGIVGYPAESETRPATAGDAMRPPRSAPQSARPFVPPSPAREPVTSSATSSGVTRPALSGTPLTGPAVNAPAAQAPASAASPVTPDVARIRAILEASSVRHRSPFEVLGLEPTMDESEIRRAYSGLARVLHPDVALDPSLEELRHLREPAFVQLGQAFETLRSSLVRRQAVDKAAREHSDAKTAPARPAAPSAPAAAEKPAPAPRQPAPPAPDPPHADPDRVVRTAQRHFETEQYWEAIQLLEPLLEQKNEAAIRVRAQMLLAQAYLKNPNWTKRAEETVLELLRESPRHVPAHLLLADLYRASGFTARARSAYQKVLALQPEHRTAAQAIAELPLPPEPESEPARPGRLRGILGKR